MDINGINVLAAWRWPRHLEVYSKLLSLSLHRHALKFGKHPFIHEGKRVDPISSRMVAPYCPKSVFGLDYRIILIIINPHKIDVIAQYKLVVIHLSCPCSKYSSDINHHPKQYSVFILSVIYLSEYSSVITLSVHILSYIYNIYIYILFFSFEFIWISWKKMMVSHQCWDLLIITIAPRWIPAMAPLPTPASVPPWLWATGDSPRCSGATISLDCDEARSDPA